MTTIDWVDVNDHLPPPDTFVLAWLIMPGSPPEVMAEFFMGNDDHMLVMLRRGTMYIDRLLNRNPPMKWLLATEDVEIKQGAVRYWAHFTPPAAVLQGPTAQRRFDYLVGKTWIDKHNNSCRITQVQWYGANNYMAYWEFIDDPTRGGSAPPSELPSFLLTDQAKDSSNA
jgi:hypothetical protein